MKMSDKLTKAASEVEKVKPDGEIVKLHLCQNNPHLAVVIVKSENPYHPDHYNEYIAWTVNLESGGLHHGVYCHDLVSAENGFDKKVALYD
jgi:hypothetical protein